MKPTTLLMIPLLCCSLLLACSDDDKSPESDAQPADQAVNDAAPSTDTTVDATPGPDMGSDALVVPDANLSICEAECLALAPFFCVKVGGDCESCTGDEHCAANPHSLGPKCEVSFNLCMCDVDAECVGHLHGGKCNDSAFMCSCETDEDCLPGLKCTGMLANRKVCEVVAS